MMHFVTEDNEGSQMLVDKEVKSSLLLEDVIQRPKLLKESAGGNSCSIFRAPHTLRQTHKTAFEPTILSIGPYHHCSTVKDNLQMIEEHKRPYLEFFVSKTEEKGVSLSDLVDVVWEKEEKIRDCYSETLQLDTKELTDLMVLDGCFILMLFLVVSRTIEYRRFNDPIFKLRWILPTLRQDLLLLENQVPLFLLNDLLQTSKLAPSTSLNEIAFEFFNYALSKPKVFWDKHKNLRAKHLLDLIRKTFIPVRSPPTIEQQCCINILSDPSEDSRREANKCTDLGKMCFSKDAGMRTPPPSPFLGLIVSAKKLGNRGIKFKQRTNVDTPLDISFEKSSLQIPILVFDEFFSLLCINSIAFEQLNMKCSSYMTSYIAFMGCLINTEEDAIFLGEKGIIENYFGTGEQVSLFFKNIGKDISFSISKSYLANEFEGVNKFRGFKTPWKLLSSSAALVLLILTIFQTFFAAYAYFRPPKPN